MIFLRLFFHISLRVRLFFVAKGNLKFSDLKMRWREKSEKFSLCDTLNCILTFWDSKTEALAISKRLNFP